MHSSMLRKICTRVSEHLCCSLMFTRKRFNDVGLRAHRSSPENSIWGNLYDNYIEIWGPNHSTRIVTAVIELNSVSSDEKS